MGLTKTAVQHGQQHQRQRGGADQTTDHHNRQGALDFRAWAGGQQQGHQAKGGDGGRHQHGAQAAQRAFAHHLFHGQAQRVQVVEVRHQHQAIEHGNPQQRDETDRCGHRQVLPGQPQRGHAAHHGKGHVAQDERGLAHRAKGHEQHKKDQSQGHGHHQPQAGGGALLVLELAAPFHAVAGGQGHIAGDGGAGFGHKANQVATADAGLDQGKARAVFAAHQHGAIGDADAGQCRKGDVALVATRQAQILKALGRGAQWGVATHHDGGAPVGLNHHTGRHAFQLGAQLILNLRHSQSGAARSLGIDLYLQVFHGVAGLGEYIARAGHFLDAGGHALCQVAQGVQIGAKQFDGHIATAAGEHFRNAHLDGLGEAKLQAGEVLHHLADLGAQGFLVGHAPLLVRCQLHEHVGLVQAHGVQAQLVRAHAGNAVLHLGYGSAHSALHRQIDLQRTLQADGRGLLQLQQDVALIHRGHKGFAGAQVGGHAQCQRGQGHSRCALWVAQCRFQQRCVQAQSAAHDPRLAVRMLLEQQRCQHRHQSERQQQRHRQRKHDRQGHRNKQLAFQPLQGEQGHKRQTDDENA